ncbi:heme ABC exporter ATP-binding protein CcmA [Blastococcus goldschmidtiae]|uniref:Heme ABC exporter ATP-binding protein CcmA n=1 Tax=Blastococcus goldschmidtiae TaxID=3075546 RepID=A0ABU2K5X0_9ACTN|nr:heme ABC exporter ATP-binding protein CcmA [Blastococcus sp. DSM 46792]MDT0275579.1 heme ABC exporter ATP-binding protein CcmA [Blastococcus sp. DSM 46792]
MIELCGISVSVERTPVLRDLTLTVGAGEAVGVTGANGSGKSTLLRLLATLLSPAAGTGRALGSALGSRECERIRPHIGLIGHSPALYSRLTLAENLRFFCRLTGVDVSAVGAALDAVGLGRSADRPVDRCSQGMQRRAELARVILTKPTLLLLDEPHAGLDTGSAGLVDAIIDDVCERGGAAVVVSHDRARLDVAVDRVLDLRAGSLHDALPSATVVPGQGLR